MSESRQYELVYIVSPETDEEGVSAMHVQITEIAEKMGGQIERTDNWGRRRLAYEINRHREGTYVLELINGPGEMVHEIDRRLRVHDQVLRHLLVRVDEDLRKAQRARDRRQAKVHRRRAAKGVAPAAAAPVDAQLPSAWRSVTCLRGPISIDRTVTLRTCANCWRPNIKLKLEW